MRPFEQIFSVTKKYAALSQKRQSSVCFPSPLTLASSLLNKQLTNNSYKQTASITPPSTHFRSFHRIWLSCNALDFSIEPFESPFFVLRKFQIYFLLPKQGFQDKCMFSSVCFQYVRTQKIAQWCVFTITFLVISTCRIFALVIGNVILIELVAIQPIEGS